MHLPISVTAVRDSIANRVVPLEIHAIFEAALTRVAFVFALVFFDVAGERGPLREGHVALRAVVKDWVTSAVLERAFSSFSRDFSPMLLFVVDSSGAAGQDVAAVVAFEIGFLRGEYLLVDEVLSVFCC